MRRKIVERCVSARKSRRSISLGGTAKECRAVRWARRLTEIVQGVIKAHPGADPDNIRHALILFEKPPLERLATSLLRGRTYTKRWKRFHPDRKRIIQP